MQGEHIFISYSSRDENEVQELLQLLQKEKISYWKAPEMIPIGSNYAKEIPNMIGTCAAFMLVISNNSMDSIWVEKELDFAINRRKVIVPVAIEDCQLSDMFTFYLNNVQTIYYNEGIDRARSRLLERLKGIVGVSADHDKKEAGVSGDHDIKEVNASNKKEEAQRSEAIEDTVIKKQGLSRKSIEVRSWGRSTKDSALEKEKTERYFEEGGHSSPIKDSSFGLNPQPKECYRCGGNLITLAYGVYKCVKCHTENYDYFHLVRNYLEKAGPSTKKEIEEATGVPKASIDYFYRQEMLEIPRSSSERVKCRRCGREIRTGNYCEKCKKFSFFI